MRLREELFFAPGIRFSEVDLSGAQLPGQLLCRLEGFYVVPAMDLARCGHAFAAGVVLVSCIDALAFLDTEHARVGERFRQWCKRWLPSFANTDIAAQFYQDFRNGLVHEARVKNGGEFSLETDKTVMVCDTILRVNPAFLGEEVRQGLTRYTTLVMEDEYLRLRLTRRIIGIFQRELTE